MVGIAGSTVKVYIGDQQIGETQTLKYERDDEIKPMGTFGRLEGTCKLTGVSFDSRLLLRLQADALRKEKHRRAARAGLNDLRLRVVASRARQTGKRS